MKVKDMFVRVCAMKASGRGEVIFNFLTSNLMTSLISFTTLPLFFWRKVPRYPLNRILAESLSRSESLGEKKQSYRC